MSNLDCKANYHAGTALNASYPTGSHAMPGNGYYSVLGTAPRVRTNHNSSIQDPKYKFSQSHRIDAVDSLLKLKEDTTLTHYFHHNPPVETARDKYLHVPTFVPRAQNADALSNNNSHDLVSNQEYEQFKALANDRSEYRLNRVNQLPGLDYNVLPETNLNDEAYRLYGATKPYDMAVLRDTSKYHYGNLDQLQNTDPNFISASTIPR